MEGPTSTETSEVPQTKVDTNSEMVRITRARNEAGIYGLRENWKGKRVEDLSSLSFVERLATVRENILPPEEFATISNEDKSPGQIISRTNEKQGFPRVDVVATDLLPSLSRIIDQSEEAISAMPEGSEKDGAALRLASAMFVLGIVEHPGVDVNGQTFRVLSLSYLHELSSKYKDRYFPLKFSQYLDRRNLNITTSFHDTFASVDIPPIEPKTQIERDLINFIKQFDQEANKMPTVDDYTPNFSYNQNLELYRMARRFAEEHDMPQIVEGLKPVEWRDHIKVLGRETRFTRKQGKEDVPELTSSTVRGNVFSVLEGMSYKRPEIIATLGGDPAASDKVTRSMLALLRRGGPGIKLVQDYILGRPVDLTNIDGTTKRIFELARGRFDQVGSEMDTILSDSAISSKVAIESQLQLVDKYESVNEGLREIMHTQGWSAYSRILDEMYAQQTADKPQAETVAYLENKYLKKSILAS